MERRPGCVCACGVSRYPVHQVLLDITLSSRFYIISMIFKKNDIVDYFDNRRIACGVVRECDEKRLRVLNDRGQEANVSPGRVLTSGPVPEFPLGGSRDDQVARLKEISAHREDLKNSIDLKELWEVVGTETDLMEIEDLAELYFGIGLDPHNSASLLRAVIEDKLYFKYRPDGLEVHSPARVEQALLQREKERKQRNFIASAADFLAKLKNGEAVDVSGAPEGLVELLEEAAYLGKDWTTLKRVKDIFSQAGVGGDVDPFRVLVILGVWTQDENIRLRAEKVPVEFDAPVLDLAHSAAQRPEPSSRADLTGLETVAVDSVTTKDVDDALSISFDDDGVTVGIHITDPSHFVEQDSPLDLHIRRRAISIYLPEITIPMMPPILSEMAASLAVGEIRPATSLLVRMGPDFAIKSFEIHASVVRLTRRISYEEADERIRGGDTPEAKMFEVALALRQRRVDSGALIFKDPEVGVQVDEHGAVQVTVRDRESPSQILVSEMMIFANNLFARFLRENRAAGIFRSQAPPSERIELSDDYDPVLSFRARRALVRGDVGVVPAPHSTLGLDCYTTATSPLRRYPDLLTQRQINSLLYDGKPLLNRDQLEAILGEISYQIDRAGMMERERRRYYLLKHLSTLRKNEFEAVVLHRFPKFHLVQMVDFSFNAPLNTPDGLTLRPYDRAIVRIEKVNPRHDKLNLSLIRLL